MEKEIDCVPALSYSVSTGDPAVKFMAIEASMKSLEKAAIFCVAVPKFEAGMDETNTYTGLTLLVQPRSHEMPLER
jgi:hypothetical protein